MGDPMPDPSRVRPMTPLASLAARAVPHDLPSQELPRVRLIHGIITCPRCGKKAYHLRMRSGEAWLPCNHERTERRGACTARWLNLTIPAGTIGADLERVVGRSAALALIRLVFPHLAAATDEQVLLIALAWGTEEDREQSSHFQILVRGHDEHLYRWRPVADVLRALGIGG